MSELTLAVDLRESSTSANIAIADSLFVFFSLAPFILQTIVSLIPNIKTFPQFKEMQMIYPINIHCIPL